MPEVLRYQARPPLRRPTLIVAVHGWSDAGDAATMALGYLRRRWNAEPLAEIDPEEFYDFQEHRPQVVLTEDDERRIEWPANEFRHAAVPGTDHDAILFEAVEPSMRWRTYCEAVVELARAADVQMVVTLGALLAGRPHTRPVKVTGTALDPDLLKRLDLQRSRYQGPTGISGVLHDACARAGLPAVSLWAWVPVYLQQSPSPPAALELLRRLRTIVAFETDLAELEKAADEYQARVSEAVSSDPDVVAQVADLERQADNEEDFEQLPSGDQLAAEFERYLRDRGDESE